MKRSFALAASLVLVMSPVLAQTHHRARVRRAPDGGSVVTAGSSVRITSTGEVIGPPNTIIIVSPTVADRDQGKSRPNAKPSTPAAVQPQP